MLKTIFRYLKSGPALNLWSGYLCFASLFFYGVLSLPLAVRFLEKEELGLWNLVTQVVTYLLWLDLGVSTMTGRTMAEPIQRGDQQTIDRTWSSILCILSCQSLIIIVAGCFFAPYFVDFFKVPPRLESDALFVFIGTVLVSSLSLPLRAVPGIFLCQDRLHWTLMIQGSLPWISLLVFWIFLEAGMGVRSYVFSTGIANLVQFFVLRLLLRQGQQEINFRPRLVSKAAVKPILGFSSSMMLWGIAPAAIGSIPAIVIGKQLTLGYVSIYNVTSKIPMMIAAVALRTYHSFYPRIQKHFVAGESEKFRTLFRLSTWLSMWASGIALLPIVFLNEAIVGFLAKPDFFAGRIFTAIIVFGLLGMASAEHLGSLFYCAGKSKLVSIVLAFEVLITFTVATWLCHLHGLIGIAIAIACIPLALRIPYFAWFGPKTCGTRLRELYTPCITGMIAILCIGTSLWIFTHYSGTAAENIIAVSSLIGAFFCSFLSLRAGYLDFFHYRNLQHQVSNQTVTIHPEI